MSFEFNYSSITNEEFYRLNGGLSNDRIERLLDLEANGLSI